MRQSRRVCSPFSVSCLAEVGWVPVVQLKSSAFFCFFFCFVFLFFAGLGVVIVASPDSPAAARAVDSVGQGSCGWSRGAISLKQPRHAGHVVSGVGR